MLSLNSLHKVSVQEVHGRGKRFRLKSVCKMGSLTATKAPTMGLDDLLGTVTVNVEKAEYKTIRVTTKAPFSFISDTVENVGIRVDLSNGCTGWGEIAACPSENSVNIVGQASLACENLVRRPLMSLGSALGEIGEAWSGHELAPIRSGVEMALIDAAAKTIGLPLWRLFGGASDKIMTAITIQRVSPNDASAIAWKYFQQGFKTLKIKLRNDLNSDIEVLQVIRNNHPDCSIILDGDERYSTEEAIKLLDKLRGKLMTSSNYDKTEQTFCPETSVKPVMFEQPVHRDDWDGLRYITRQAKKNYGVSIAADESCTSVLDAKTIVKEHCADVIIVKLAKNGVMGSLDIIKVAKTGGVEVMVGGMIETRLATGFAGHLAAGYGCFGFADLGSPLFLEKDPVFGGYEVCGGSVYKLSNSRGHAGFQHWDDLIINN